MTARCLLFLCVLAVPGRALADADEATLAFDAGPALFISQAPVYSSARSSRPGVGAGLRLGYGLSDLLELDLAVSGSLFEGVEYADQPVDDPRVTNGVATIHHDHRGVRALAGMTARFGARLIPTVAVAVGYQQRVVSGGQLLDAGRNTMGPFDDAWASDLLVSAAVGLDLRLGRHLIIGVAAQVTHSFPLSGAGFDALELPIRISYQWYPGWFQRHDIERLDDR